MGSIGSCCILNSSTRSALSNQKTQTEISVDIPNSIVPYTHSSKSKSVFKANEITDHSTTSVASTNLRPKRNRSSIVLKPAKYKMKVDRDSLKRANSALEEVSHKACSTIRS